MKTKNELNDITVKAFEEIHRCEKAIIDAYKEYLEHCPFKEGDSVQIPYSDACGKITRVHTEYNNNLQRLQWVINGVKANNERFYFSQSSYEQSQIDSTQYRQSVDRMERGHEQSQKDEHKKNLIAESLKTIKG